MRYFMVTALGLALLAPSVASADCYGGCHGGWGHCYGGRGHGCHGGCWGSCHGGCWGGGCSGGGCSGCWGGGHAYRGGYGGYAMNGYYSYPSVANYDNGYYYSSPSSVYNSPFVDGNTMSRASNYLDRGVEVGNGKQVRMQIMLPDANADLFIQGQKMTSKGSLRVFDSPNLESGKSYIYTVKMQRAIDGKTQEEIRNVDVQAGNMISVDFTRPIR